MQTGSQHPAIVEASTASGKIRAFQLSSDRNQPLAHETKPSYSIDQVVEKLTCTQERIKDLDGNGRVELAYHFQAPGPAVIAELFPELHGLSAFNAQQQAQARVSMQGWSDAANISFHEGAGGADGQLYFGNFEQADDDAEDQDEREASPCEKLEEQVGAGAVVEEGQAPEQDATRVVLGGFNERLFNDDEQATYVWINLGEERLHNHAPAQGNTPRLTLVHEIGHAIGLEHPSYYESQRLQGAEFTYGNYAFFAQDSLAYSVMSYLDESNTGQAFARPSPMPWLAQQLPFIWSSPITEVARLAATFSDPLALFKLNLKALPSAPMMDDIAAIQALYGANMSTRTGDTTYGFNANNGRDFLSATKPSDKLVFSIWDAGGNDTLDFSGYAWDQQINLGAGSFSNVGGLRGNVSIARDVAIENAVGGSGDDWLVGNALANQLRGGAGNDLLFGAGGADTLWGGAGADSFVFAEVADSSSEDADLIMDFHSGEDCIDLYGITQGAGLRFVEAFTGQAGEAQLSYDAQTDRSALRVDFSGQGVADFQINTLGQVLGTDILA